MFQESEKTLTNIDPARFSAIVLVHGHQSRTVNDVLRSHGFEVSSPKDVATAEELCARTRFDLAVYDQDVEGALDLARDGALSSKPRVSVGLIREERSLRVPGLRVHFVLHKPFTRDFFVKTIRAAHGPIAADRRANLRHQVSLEAETYILHHGELRSLERVKVVNLSQTGLCLQASEMLPQGSQVELTFTLPRNSVTVQLGGNVVWAHSSGRAGVKFSELSEAERHKLEQWSGSFLPELVRT
jgi:DNA-binding response OmpR family regulator